MLLSFYALILFGAFRDAPHLIALFAMLLSSLGDIVLMDFEAITMPLRLRGFVTGAGVFLLAQIMYLSTFIYKMAVGGHKFIVSGVCFTAILFILIYGATVIITIRRHSGGLYLLIPCFFYLLVTSLVCAAVFSYALPTGGRANLSIIGIIFFLISECLTIARHICGIRSKAINELTWWFYPLGQILLLTGV